ncbi:MAG: septum formation initiator family protein [Prevotella sp.]|nr:septum formation initiator family protein [Prevotella sp.]
MKKLKTFISRIGHIPALKYIVVTVIAIVFIGFVDENSIWRHMCNRQHISELQDEIKRLTDQHNYNQSQIRLLGNDTKAIEKIARERYFMKTDEEDIFVLSDDEQTQSFTNDDETAE